MSSFRLAGHRLEPRAPAVEMVQVAGQVGGIQAQVMSAAEMALGVRVDGITRADVARALWVDRTLVKTWAVRGTLHLLPSADLPVFMAACRSRSDSWWRAWERHFGLSRPEVERLVDAIGEALNGRTLTRRDLIEAAVSRLGGSDRVRAEMESGWGTLLKPAARAGVLCFGPSRGQEVTFVRADQWVRGWRDLEEVEAAVELLRRYLRANAPANREDFGRWLGMTPVVRRAWSELLPELQAVEGGFALPDYEPLPLPASCLRLLPYFDVYLLSHAKRTHLVAGELLHRVSRTAGWIAPVILSGRVVAGTWELRGGAVVVDEFRPLTLRERRELAREVVRLGRFLGASVMLG